MGEKILDVFAREFRAHPAEEYVSIITAAITLANYQIVICRCRSVASTRGR